MPQWTLRRLTPSPGTSIPFPSAGRRRIVNEFRNAFVEAWARCALQMHIHIDITESGKCFANAGSLASFFGMKTRFSSRMTSPDSTY